MDQVRNTARLLRLPPRPCDEPLGTNGHSATFRSRHIATGVPQFHPEGALPKGPDRRPAGPTLRHPNEEPRTATTRERLMLKPDKQIASTIPRSSARSVTAHLHGILSASTMSFLESTSVHNSHLFASGSTVVRYFTENASCALSRSWM